MKNLYAELGRKSKTSGSTVRRGMKLLGLSVLFAATAVTAKAQTWTGTTNNNFMLENNWTPAGSPVGKNLTIPILDATKTADDPVNRLPVVSGSTNIAVLSMDVVYNADAALIRPVTINLENDATFTVQNGGTASNSIDYDVCGIVLNSGKVYFTGYGQLSSNNSIITINGGYMELSSKSRPWQLANKAVTAGGQFVINGGTLRIGVGGTGRTLWTRPGGQFVIKNDGKFEIVGDYRSWQQYINSGYLNGGDDFNVVLSFDALANLTTFKAVPSSSFLVANGARQVLKAGVAGTPINMLLTKRVNTAKSLTWKYHKQGEDTYYDFDVAQTGTSCTPVFAQSGVYYVACVGVDADDVTVYSDEVEVFVGSDKISISPFNTSQYIRVNQPLYELTATFTGEASNIEWKYSTTPSGPYTSFDPLATNATYSPLFGSTGLYYVVVEATIDNVLHRSAEMTYIVEAANTTSKWITWQATYDTNFQYGANYLPAAVHFKNSINIPAGVTPPTINQAGNDTIMALTIADGQTVTMEKPEGAVLNLRDEVLVNGTLYVNSGVVDHAASVFRIPQNGDLMVVQGNAEVKTVNLLIGNQQDNPNQGGILELRENAKFYNTGGLPSRFSIDIDGEESVIKIYDNAMLYIKGDVRSAVKDLIDTKLKIRTPGENCIPYYFYDKVSNYTIVRARNTTTFSIDKEAVQYASANSPIATGLSVVNVDASFTTLAWYWSESPLGPWTKIEGSDDVVPFAPQFSATGTYYVIAKANGTIESSNMVRVEVIELEITPSTQKILPNTDGAVMSVTLPASVSINSNAWWNVTNPDVEPVQLSDKNTYTPNFPNLGTYKIVYAVELKDEYSNTYQLVSKEATVEVVSELPTSIDKPKTNKVVVYPNPSNGTFYVSAGVNATVEVVDLKGAVVLTKNITSSAQPISVTAKGVYLVKVIDGGKVSVSRVIVK